MKPSLTVDERGLVVHFTNDRGEGVAVPITSEMVKEAKNTFEKLATTPEGKRRVLQGLGRLFLELTESERADAKKV